VQLRGHTGGAGSVALARDGRTLAWISQSSTPGAPASEIHVYDLARGAILAVLRGHGRPVRCLALSPDGSAVVSAAGTDEPAELLIWKVSTGRLVQALGGHAAGVAAVAYSPDGRSVASAGTDGAVKVHDLVRGGSLLLRTTAKPARVLAFSSDGKSLAVGGGPAGRPSAIDVFDAVTGSIRGTIAAADGVSSLALSADGTLIAHAGKGGQVHLVDASSGAARHTLSVGMKGIACIALSPDSQTLAVAGTAAGVKLWDVPTGQERASLPRHQGGACFVAFDGAGQLLVTASATRQARLWRKGP
jgi:WD40 repeat protein